MKQEEEGRNKKKNKSKEIVTRFSWNDYKKTRILIEIK